MRGSVKYLCIFLMILQTGCIDGILSTEEYRLPNGYEYFVPQSGMHMIVKKGGGVNLGYYLNRAYVDDRYVVGEVILRPEASDRSDQEHEFSFFIFDTKSGRYSSDLTKSQFEEDLENLELWDEVELVGRDSEFWLKSM